MAEAPAAKKDEAGAREIGRERTGASMLRVEREMWMIAQMAKHRITEGRLSDSCWGPTGSCFAISSAMRVRLAAAVLAAPRSQHRRESVVTPRSRGGELADSRSTSDGGG
jgi:hypothetical protein